MLIATDARVFAVDLRRIWDMSRPLWTVPYVQIKAIEPHDKKHDVPMTLRTARQIQHIAVRELLTTSYDYQKYHQAALL